MNTMRKHLCLLLLVIAIFGCISGCASEKENSFTEPKDFMHAKIGVLTGSSQSVIAKEQFPDAQLVYFSTPADMVLAVEQEKIDCYMFGSPFLAATIWEDVQVKRLDEAIAQGDIAFAFSESSFADSLREQLNEFINTKKNDGTLDYLQEKWLGKTEPTEHPDYESLTGENGTIRLAVVAENKPMIYQHIDQFTGLEMELLTAFAREYGYKFQMETVPFDSIIMGLATGKYDMAAASLQVTPERAESVKFSDPYMQFDVVLVVKDNGTQETEMCLSDLQNANIGIVIGTIWESMAQEQFPDANIKYFNYFTDALIALEQGKVDTFFADRSLFYSICWETDTYDYIDQPMGKTSNALIMAKNNYNKDLLDELNEFIAKAWADGTINRLENKWFGEKEPTEHPDYTKLTGERGTLKIAVSDSLRPNAYKKDALYTGYDIEFMTLFAEEYGYNLELEGMTFDAIIPYVSSGKADIGASGFAITSERMESVTFTDPYFETHGVAVILDESKADEETVEIVSLEDLQTAKIAIMNGTVWDVVAKKALPDAQLKYFSSTADTLLALEQGLVDCIFGPRTFYVTACWEDVKVDTLDETIDYIESGFILPKEGYNETLLEQLNEFIELSSKDGTLKDLEKKWFSDSEPLYHPDYESLTGENGVLRIAVDNATKPMAYRKSDFFTGFDIDFLTLFAKEYGYGLEFVGMSFDALIPYVTLSKCDMGACGIGYTPERAESVTFTDPYVKIDGTVMVRHSDSGQTIENFFESVGESFEKTFIREDRWILIIEGIVVTLFISLCAATGGTLLGMGLYMLSRADGKVIQFIAKKTAKLYSRIIEGTPAVVILMILFYVIFGSFRNMSGILVAIIGFSLTFGAFVYNHMTVAVSSVDRGQTDAAYSLGYTKNKAFFRIILPQAMKIFLPSYCGNFVELVKGTAVVGYIAVNDLTKMGDIIRSNTYEAFFPLIATAVIYFVLTWILSLLLKRINKRFDPQIRDTENILRNVKTKD